MADESLGTGSVTIELDDSAIDTALDRLSDRIERALDRAARDGARRMERQLNQAVRRISPLKVRVEADLSAFDSALNDLNNLGSAPIRITPEVDRDTFVAQAQAAIAGLEVSITVVPDMSGFDRRVAAHPTPTVEVNVAADTDRFRRALGGLGKVAGRLAGLAKTTLTIGALGIAAAGAATAVGGLVAALAPLAGLLAALPAVIIGVQVATGTLKLALLGVSDAFGAALTGDAKEFEKSLENLSPKAQAAAREVRALKPAFENLRDAVQDAFFARLEGDITRTAKALQGPLQSGLKRIASSWGQAAKNVLGYVQGAKGVSNIKTIIAATGQSVEGLSLASNKLTAGVLQIAAAISKAFGPELAGGIAAAGQRFGEFLSNAANSGRAVEWVDTALTNLSKLGDVLGNIGGVLSGLFQAGNDAGAGFLSNLQRITQSFETFVQSAQGQEAIGNIFRTLGTVAAQLGPILQALVTTLGAVLPAVTPLLTAVGPAILGLVKAIGPLIEGILPGINAVVSGIVAALNTITASGVLESLGQEIGDVLEAFAPLLPVIGELAVAVGSILAPVISALATALTPVIQALVTALQPVIPVLTEAFVSLVTALSPLVTTLGQVLGPIIVAFSPLLVALATALGSIATAVAPLITQLVDALLPVFLALAPAITQIVEAIVPLIAQLVDELMPVLQPLIDAYIAILEALVPIIPVVADLVTELAPLIALIISALGPILTFAANIIKWLTIKTVVPGIQAVIDIIEGIVKAVGDVIDGVKIFVKTVSKFFSDLGRNVSEAVSDLVDNVTQFFSELPGKVRSAMSSLGSNILQVLGDAKDKARSKAIEIVTDVVEKVRELPGKAKAALGNIGTLLASAGADLIRGLIGGIRDMAGSLVSAAQDVVGGAVDAAKNLLGIKSPSKVFREIGRFVGQGFVNGMTSSEASIRQTADRLAKLVTDAFKGKKTTRDDNLIRAVRQTQRDLEALARQREALAQRIAEANEFAVQTSQSALQSFNLSGAFDEVNRKIKELKENTTVSNRKGLRINVIGDLTDSIEASAARIRRFNKQITDLAKRGVRKDILSQLIGLGPDAGADLAQQLSSASNAQLRELNAAQKQLDAAAKKFGKDSADKMFDAGKQSANGFLAGLKGQQKAIEALMLDIAKSMARSIRRALGIKSPSTVFREIGEFVGEGLVRGIDAMGRAVARSSAAMGARATTGFRTGNAFLPGLTAVTQPFGAGSVPGGLGSLNAAQRASQGLGATTSSPFAGQGERTVNIEQGAIVINEVGNAETTATRIVNRLVGSGVSL